MVQEEGSCVTALGERVSPICRPDKPDNVISSSTRHLRPENAVTVERGILYGKGVQTSPSAVFYCPQR
jgi:hypothetical protein